MNQPLSHVQYAKIIARQYGVGRAMRFWLAALADRAAMQNWVAFVEAHLPPPSRLAMVMRPLRPYMRQNFDVAARRNVLQQHLTIMADYGLTGEALAAEPGVVVAALSGKSGVVHTVHFGGNTSKEGEVAFTFLDDQGQMLAKITGTLAQETGGERLFWVGGLQGAKPPLGRDEIVKATRDLYGLRPKGAVLLALQAFAQALQLTAIHAPGNEGHISQRGLRRLREKRKIYADYGQFWEEIGGVKIGAEEYRLPIIPLVRSIEEVKQNKRSEWKKRQALSEQIATETTATLARLSHGTVRIMQAPDEQQSKEQRSDGHVGDVEHIDEQRQQIDKAGEHAVVNA